MGLAAPETISVNPLSTKQYPGQPSRVHRTQGQYGHLWRNSLQHQGRTVAPASVARGVGATINIAIVFRAGEIISVTCSAVAALGNLLVRAALRGRICYSQRHNDLFSDGHLLRCTTHRGSGRCRRASTTNPSTTHACGGVPEDRHERLSKHSARSPSVQVVTYLALQLAQLAQ